MGMDAEKKAELEKKMVIGLAGVFVLVLVLGPLRSMLFGKPSQPPAGAPAAVPEAERAVTVSAPQAALVQEGGQGAGPAPADAESVGSVHGEPAYTAYDLRDPFTSFFPQPPMPTPESIAEAVAELQAPDMPPPPELHIEGLVWGGDVEPKAIIDRKVYGVNDRVQGATILAIDRSGVTVDYEGTPMYFTTVEK